MAPNTQNHVGKGQSFLNKRTMMVLYHSPRYLAVMVHNKDKYKKSKFKVK